MSAVRQYNYMRTAVVDGRPVLLKRCGRCEVEKECSMAPSSEFYVAQRNRANPTWFARCKACHREMHALRVEADPEFVRRRRAQDAAYRRCHRDNPEYRERGRKPRRKRPVEYVPNEGLRAAAERAVEREVVGMDALSRVVFPKADWPSLRLRRALGIQPYWKGGREYVQARVSVEVAVRVVRALDLDPVDFGV